VEVARSERVSEGQGAAPVTALDSVSTALHTPVLGEGFLQEEERAGVVTARSDPEGSTQCTAPCTPFTVTVVVGRKEGASWKGWEELAMRIIVFLSPM
jgi:hypothetical protein